MSRAESPRSQYGAAPARASPETVPAATAFAARTITRIRFFDTRSAMTPAGSEADSGFRAAVGIIGPPPRR